MVDMECAMNNACRYDNIAVVEWFWTNLERQLFNVKNAWSNACYNCNKKLISYLLNNMSEHILDKSKALVHACRNDKEGYKVISLLLGQPSMNTPENCKLVLTEACVHCNKNVVKWLLTNTDIQPLEYKDTLIDTIKATKNKSNKKIKLITKTLFVLW
ncbi:unnamed protein product [Mytilus edulis]|uniref:Ankyrin repeat protein n=1 Tax=Mytilus edulis TaxID=6550 RepID=A0A8S3V3Q8_MYTED|nr:unnamed protein product [Mytilus edulis]